MDSNELKNFINGIGALSEMAALLRDSLMQNGFSREEACGLVGVVIAETFRPNR